MALLGLLCRPALGVPHGLAMHMCPQLSGGGGQGGSQQGVLKCWDSCSEDKKENTAHTKLHEAMVPGMAGGSGTSPQEWGIGEP